MTDEIVKETPSETEVTPEEEVAVEVAATEDAPKKNFWADLGANLKERWRKFLVTTKRKPQRLAFFPLIISTILWMFGVVYCGRATIYDNIGGMGLCIFVNTMLSILTLLLFMNTFPKRAKHMNYIMLALTFLFMAVMLTCDLVWYIQSYPVHMSAYESATADSRKEIEVGLTGFSIVLTHVVFVALSAILLATLPIYKKWILKINTAKAVEVNELKEEIDTSAEV